MKRPLKRGAPWFAVSIGAWLAACGAGADSGETGDPVAADDDVLADDDRASDDDASEDASDDDAGDDDRASDDDTGDDVADVPALVPVDAETADELLDERIDATFGGLADTVQGIEESDAMGSGMADDMMSDLTDCGGIEPVQLNLGGLLGNQDDALREFGDVLKNEVFRDELIESDDGSRVVYRLEPEVVCSEDDLECQQELTETPVRFAVTRHEDDSLRVVLQVGEARDEPATMLLADDRIVVTADLEELLEALRNVVDPEQADALPDSLAGVVEASIVKNDERAFSYQVAILETVSFTEAVGEAGEVVLASLAASPQAISAVVDGVQNSLVYAIDLHALDLSLPGSALCGEESDCGAKEREGTFQLHLDGLSAGTVLEDGATEISVSNIGLGDATSYARLNREPLVEVDLNPDAGRRFAMQLRDTANGTVVSFEPKLDLTVATTLENLSAALRADLPEWLADEIFSVTFGGEPKAQLIVPDGCSEAGHALEVRQGTLTLDASSAAGPVVVEAGMCLSQVETDSEHPFDALGVVACE